MLHQQANLPDAALLLVLAIAALAVVARCGFRIVTLPALAVLAFCWTATVATQQLASQWPAAADGEDLELVGWIDDLPRYDSGRAVFSLRVEASAMDDPPRRVRLSWYDPPAGLVAGQALAVVARLRSPRGLVNPGGFDYERWLFVEYYGATGYVRDGQLTDSGRFRLAQQWQRIRGRLVARIAALTVDPDGSALMAALSLGERGGFDDRHWTVLQRTGTSHLVAVSGLHIGLIATLAYAVILRVALFLPYRYACRAHRYAAIGCMLPAIAYAALAGFALPTRRALIMLLVAQCVIVGCRRWSVATGLSAALVLVLGLDPLATLTASFWLSFGAVAVLLAVVVRPVRSRASSSIGVASLFAFGRLQWALTVGLLPLTVWFFGQVSFASLFVNLLAIPVFSLVAVPLCLAAVCAMLVAEHGLGLPDMAAGVAGWLWRALEFAAAAPVAAMDLSPPRFGAVLIAVAAVAMALPWHRLPCRRLALVGLLPLAFRSPAGLDPGAARLTVLDVGHGLAVVIETASHRALFDAGPVYLSGFDAGAQIVGPAVAALAAAPLDLLILSHGDSDHAGGASAIVERYPGVPVLAGPDVELYGAQPCLDGQQWTWDRVRFTMLHPPAAYFASANESSCVLRIEASHASALLTGDIEGRAEARLSSDAGVAADVVVVPHHGSLTSSSQAFVDAVGARVAIASSGHNNRWGFPKPEVSQRWRDGGADFLVTGDQGAIDLVLDRHSIRYLALRGQRPRYWRADRDRVSGAIALSAL